MIELYLKNNLKKQQLLDEINHELDQIENRLAQIRGEIRLLESERESLLTRKKECQSLLKDIVPSSSGGNKNDNSSNWKRTGTLIVMFINGVYIGSYFWQ